MIHKKRGSGLFVLSYVYLKTVNTEHVGAEALGSQGVADRGALVDDNDAGLLELLDVLAG